MGHWCVIVPLRPGSKTRLRMRLQRLLVFRSPSICKYTHTTFVHAENAESCFSPVEAAMQIKKASNCEVCRDTAAGILLARQWVENNNQSSVVMVSKSWQCKTKVRTLVMLGIVFIMSFSDWTVENLLALGS